MESQEQLEWDAVNCLLQHQGFRAIRFADPTENKNLADLVLLERTSSFELRVMLKTMLMDSERRQALIQELIQSNSKLKYEVEQQQTQVVCQSHRAEELEGVLAGVKVKVQGLEDSIINKAAQQQGQLQQLQQDKRDAEMGDSDGAQTAERWSRLLYSGCSVCKNDSSNSQNTDTSELTSSSYRTLLKSYQEQLKKTKAQREDLKVEIERLRRDLDSRPSVKELTWCKQQLRRMERLIQNTGVRAVRMEIEDPVGCSTETQHSITECQRYISEICSELDVQDVSQVVAVVKARCREAEFTLRLEKTLSDITAILTGPRAPLTLLRHPDATAGSELEQIVPTLEMWSRQLGALPDLQRSVSRLVRRLLPWQREDGTGARFECVKVEDVILMVDTLLDETARDDKVLQTPTEHTLQAMVSHFQKLFDVVSLHGIYPRMNEVYTRLEEMNNTMRHLRDILDMDERAPPSDVVLMVARIMDHGNPHERLRISDIDSIIVKLREHEEFFPAFHSLVLELLNTLGVESLDDILPRVRTLKSMLAGH